MQSAVDPATGRTWSAELYARTAPAHRPVTLECDGAGADGPCRAVTFFRRASVDGRRPCFFSRDHVTDCTSGSIATDDADAGPARPTAAIASRVRWVAINLDPPAPSRGPDGRRRTTEDPSQPSAPRHDVTAGTSTSEATLRPRLRAVLATLQGDGYPPGAVVRLDGFPQLPVERFFVRLEHVDAAAMSGLSRGYYGHVRSVRVDPDDGSWLVRAHDSDISVVVSARALSGSRLSGTDPATLVDGPLLALGHPRPSQRSPGRFYVKVADPTLLEIQAPARPGAGAGATTAPASPRV
ncbi:hypothetical protein [Cellulomonas marina]|uniref:Uncharacterized protein n=1 Tax=Cellulomonas marina TaxID=988821 RepID=A0A1I1AVX3_9CELL|nr:hypothetical protein [Cellulomonas marina]GIG29262.1 hypothetical protein Cma02nite_18620 [Cellulomonas marina]SFB40490.1 hypothetical protein SAMN05421867_12161 [Cellulomonas marina]